MINPCELDGIIGVGISDSRAVKAIYDTIDSHGKKLSFALDRWISLMLVDVVVCWGLRKIILDNFFR